VRTMGASQAQQPKPTTPLPSQLGSLSLVPDQQDTEERSSHLPELTDVQKSPALEDKASAFRLRRDLRHFGV